MILHDGWTLTALTPTPVDITDVPATVPGSVHTDLLSAGLIADPYADANEADLTWIGEQTWLYRTCFDAEDPDAAATSGPVRADLVFHGLDTVATVTLNGVELARTANMHRTYRLPVEQLLRPSGNELTVRFDSPVRHAEAMRTTLGERPGAYAAPYQFLRKMACNFGWDWGPALVTAGLWQPVELHTWQGARLADVRPYATVAEDTGEGLVDLRLEIERTDAAPVTVVASVEGVLQASATVVVESGADRADLRLRVPDPRLWWPRGQGGGQHLYWLNVSVRSADGTECDAWRRRIAFRTVDLDCRPDEHGTPFQLRVNGKPIFLRGVNWIPDDCFPHRVTRARYAERLRQACAAGVNAVRVWGGGRYESEDFYDLCDELGLMVSQDFLFACAAYPEEPPLAAEVEAEAREHLTRLLPHPSLTLWIGNNENIWGHADWGWQDDLAGRTWGAGYYHRLLPDLVAELDPTRPYWPGSPYSGSPDLHPNDPAHGTSHIWDVWNTHDYTHYRTWRPRFAAEFGYQAPATHRTLAAAVTGPLDAAAPEFAAHQKAENGDAKLAAGLAAHLPDVVGFDDWHYATQLNQARALTVAIEHFRALKPVCAGVLWWQLNDCWPAVSWSLVDSAGRPKPAWYALRKVFRDRLLTIQPGDEGSLALIADNDTDAPWRTTVAVSRRLLDGAIRARAELTVTVPPRGTVRLDLPADCSAADDPRAELLIADTGEDRAVWFFAEDRDIPYPPADFATEVKQVDGGYDVTVHARVLLRDLALFPDRLAEDAQVDDMLTTLLPGESVTLHVRTEQSLDTADLTRPPVLRCVNDLHVRGGHRGDE